MNPVNNRWNKAANWTPATVPNGDADIATFGVSNMTGVLLTAPTGDYASDTVADMVFDLMPAPTPSLWGRSVGAVRLVILKVME